jgi:hypothetical protein
VHIRHSLEYIALDLTKIDENSIDVIQEEEQEKIEDFALGLNKFVYTFR